MPVKIVQPVKSISNQTNMKNKRLFFTSLSIFILSFSGWSAMPYSLKAKAETITNSRLSLQDRFRIAEMKRFVNMTANEYGALRGKRLNFFERISFRLSQHRMKIMLKSYDEDGPTTLEKISWLLKGLLLAQLHSYWDIYF